MFCFLLGQTKKNGEGSELETTSTKDQTQTQGAGNVVTNGPEGGGSGSAQSQGLVARTSLNAVQQSNKRSANSEGTAKQPPSKRKKTSN